MAIRPDQLHEVHRPAPAAPATPGGQAPEGTTPSSPPSTERQITFQAEKFLNLKGTGAETDSQGRPQGTVKEKEITFYEPLIAQYESFLLRYLKQIYQINQKDPTLLTGPNHIYDQKLLSQLVDANGQPNTDKIKNFLADVDTATPENWIITTLVMDQYASKLQFSMGAKAFLNPPGKKVVWVDERTIHTGIGQGELNKAWNAATPWLTKPLNVTGERGPRFDTPIPNDVQRWHAIALTTAASARGFVEGLLRGDPLQAVAGAGVPPILAGILHSTRTGVTVDVRRLGAVFQSIKNDPNEVKFWSAMTDIELDNYEVVGGLMQLRPDRGHLISGEGPDKILEAALQTLYTRQEFFTTLGIPYKTLDELPEQFLYLPSPNVDEVAVMEQTGFRAYADIYKEFNPEQEGIQDIWGQTRRDNPWFGRADVRPLLGIPAGTPIPPGTLIPLVPGGTPDYNPANLDIASNLQRWSEARARVTTRKTEKQIKDALAEKDRKGIIQTLNDTLENFDEFKRKRQEEIGKRETALGADKTESGTERNKVTQYQTGLVKFNEQLEMARVDAQTTATKVLENILDQTGTTYPTPNAALVALSTVLSGGRPASITIEGRTITSIKRRLQQARTGLNAPLVGTNTTSQQLESQTRREAYNEAKAEIDSDSAVINGAIIGIRKAMQPKLPELPDTLTQTNSDVMEATGNLSRLPSEFNRITAWNGTGGVVLTEAELLNETVQALLTRINDINRADATRGWTEGQNYNSEYRKTLIHAMTEARARSINNLVGTPGAELTNLVGRPGWDITEHQLNTLTAQQINQMLVNRRTTNPTRYGVALGAIPELAEIEFAKAQAQERLAARTQAMEEMENYLQTQIEIAKREKEQIDLTVSEDRFKMTKSLLEGQLEIYERARDVATDGTRFFNNTLVDPANTTFFTEAERAIYAGLVPLLPGVAGLPAPGPVQYSLGYLELMDLLFSYKKGEKETRNKAFRTVSQMLPPDVLANLLDQTVGPLMIPPVAALRTDPNAVFTDTQTLLANGTMYYTQLQEVFARIANRVAEETRVRGVV